MLLIELVKVINIQKIQQAKLNKDQIRVYYNNGIIYTDMMDYPAINALNLMIDYAKNSLTFFPMGDRSDFRFIHRLQQFLSDLIKSKLVNSNWKIKNRRRKYE